MSWCKYNWCIVSNCNNTNDNSPEKMFIKVPNDKERREIWLKLAGRDPNVLSEKQIFYFCEDHFNLENDMENYSEYRRKGFVRSVKMKYDCKPSKFSSQKKKPIQQTRITSKDLESIETCPSLSFRTDFQVQDECEEVPPNWIIKENFEHICRSCIKEPGEMNIFNVRFQQVTLSQMILLCCDEEINSGDRLSKNVCGKCMKLLITSYSFIKMFRENQIHIDNLQKIFNSDKYNKTIFHCTENQYVTKKQNSDNGSVESSVMFPKSGVDSQISDSVDVSYNCSNENIPKVEKDTVNPLSAISKNDTENTQEDTDDEIIKFEFQDDVVNEDKTREENVFTGKYLEIERDKESFRPKDNSPNINTETSSITRKRRARRKHNCKFCSEYVANFSIHIERRHSDEPEVKQIMALNTKSKKRRRFLDQLRKEGDFKTAKIVPVTTLSRLPPSKFVCCPYCRGYYSPKTLPRHVKRCYQNPDPSKRCYALAEVQTQMAGHFSPYDPLRISGILKTMRPDDISLVAKRDDTVCRIARRYIRSHRSKNHVQVAKRNMRRFGSLLIESRRILGDHSLNLSDVLTTKFSDALLESMKAISGYDEKKRTFRAPSLANEMGTLIRYAINTEILKRNNSKERVDDLKSLNDFIDTKWAMVMLNTQKITSHFEPSLISIVGDIERYVNYLKELISCSEMRLATNPTDSQSFINFLEGIFCSLMIFNRKRLGEVRRLDITTVSQIEDVIHSSEYKFFLSNSEKILYKSLKRITKEDRRKLKFSVLMNASTCESIEKLLRFRRNFTLKNDFIFEMPDTNDLIKGFIVIRKHARLALHDKERASLLTTIRLRKHLPVITQILDMSNDDLEQLIAVLGLDKETHPLFFNSTDIHRIAVLTKILLFPKKNELDSFKNKHLDDIKDDVDFEDCSTTDEEDVIEPIDLGLEVGETENDIVKTIARKVIRIKKIRTVSERIRVSWTAEQKRLTEKHFSVHIKNRVAPRKHEVMELVENYPNIFHNKPYPSIKAYVYNQYRDK